MCIFGGVISDVWWGKFKTIFFFSVVYVIGCVVVSISSVPAIGISPKVFLLIGLLFIAIGRGGIRPCLCTFGGDQFKISEQATQLATFFSMYFFSTSLGSVSSATLTPILRSDVHCFGDSDCYSLAFGVPTLLMIIAIGKLFLMQDTFPIYSSWFFIWNFSVFFLVGKPSYTIVEIPSKNMLVQITRCVSVRLTFFC